MDALACLPARGSIMMHYPMNCVLDQDLDVSGDSDCYLDVGLELDRRTSKFL